MTPSDLPRRLKDAGKSKLNERAGRCPDSRRKASGVEPDALEMRLVEGMHAVIHHRFRAMVVERQPIGLDDNARILKNLLEILHDDLALVRIRDGQRLLELGVELRIGIGGLVPGLAG